MNKSSSIKFGLTVGIIGLVAACIFVPCTIAAIPGAIHGTLAGMGGGALSAGGAGILGGTILQNFIISGVGGSLGYATYKLKSKLDKKHLFHEFKNLTSDELSFVLATNITIIEFLKKFHCDTTQIIEQKQLIIDFEKEYLSDFIMSSYRSKKEIDNHKIIQRMNDLIVKKML